MPAFLLGLWSQQGSLRQGNDGRLWEKPAAASTLCRHWHFPWAASRLTSATLHPRGAGTWGRGLELGGVERKDEVKELVVMSLLEEPEKIRFILLP